MTSSEFRNWLRQENRRPLVMGVLNVTPDSFSDGGHFIDPAIAVEHALKMVAGGADWIDIGGESTRPGSLPVDPSEQIRLTIPVITAIREKTDTIISIDTTQSSVAAAALDAGANLVNDTSAGLDDADMLPLIARRSAAVVLMHRAAAPNVMQINPSYEDVTAQVSAYLVQRRQAAIAQGIEPWQILLDPGLGFGKNLAHNLQLIRDTARLASLGSPLVVGPSRKSFLGKITGQDSPRDRLWATMATIAFCTANRAAVLRVHDCGPAVQVLRVVQAICGPAAVKNI